jgi:hypothetical protein
MRWSNTSSKLWSIARLGNSVLKNGVLPSSAPQNIDFRQENHVSLTHEGFASLEASSFLEASLLSIFKFSENAQSLFQFEGYSRQRRQINQDGVFAAHPFSSFALNPTQISYVAAAVGFAVGIYDLAVEAGFRDA